MTLKIWKDCLSCKNQCCCKQDIAFPLFITPSENEKILKVTNNKCFNKKFLCTFFNKEHLCDIHNIRPIDCRLFPFDILKINNNFYWIIWEIDCPIIKYNDFEDCLNEFEVNIIPNFNNFLDAYSKFRFEELSNKYSFRILRKIILK